MTQTAEKQSSETMTCQSNRTSARGYNTNNVSCTKQIENREIKQIIFIRLPKQTQHKNRHFNLVWVLFFHCIEYFVLVECTRFIASFAFNAALLTHKRCTQMGWGEYWSTKRTCDEQWGRKLMTNIFCASFLLIFVVLLPFFCHFLTLFHRIECVHILNCRLVRMAKVNNSLNIHRHSFSHWIELSNSF